MVCGSLMTSSLLNIGTVERYNVPTTDRQTRTDLKLLREMVFETPYCEMETDDAYYFLAHL